MPLARGGSGIAATSRAYLSQVHPVFMTPPLAASLFGAILARAVDPITAAVHVVAIFAAVYTAHVKDGYVDFHVRDEDDDHPLTERGCRVGLVASSATFWACCGILLVRLESGAAIALALTVPTWLVAYHHAPQLDTNPVTATTGYPLGIALAILGGFAVQTGTLAPLPVGFALVFLVLLSGVKVIDDAQDYEYDRSIEKRTVAVVLGPLRARDVAYGLMTTGLVAVVALAAAGVFPPSRPCCSSGDRTSSSRSSSPRSGSSPSREPSEGPIGRRFPRAPAASRGRVSGSSTANRSADGDAPGPASPDGDPVRRVRFARATGFDPFRNGRPARNHAALERRKN